MDVAAQRIARTFTGMRDRRKEIRLHTRRQMASVSLDLTSLEAQELEEALVYLYASNPVRWQAFMDSAVELVQAAGVERSGFPDTTQHGDP